MGGEGWGKNQKKIHARQNAKKKIHAKKKVKKKKFMQKEGPIVTFSHVVKKIRAERFTWKKKFLQKQWAKKKFVQAENSPPPPPHFSNGPSLIPAD